MGITLMVEPGITKDQQQLQAIQAGDRSAFQRFYDQWSRPIYQYLLTMSGRQSTAEELVQELFSNIYRNPGPFAAARDLSTYLLRCAQNLYAAQLRKRKRQEKELKAEEVFVASDAPSPEEALLKQERDIKAQEALLSLNDSQRELIFLHLFEKWSFRKIAEMMDTPETTLVSRYHTALKKAKEKLHELER